jgi:hypothetical protein
MVPDGPMLLVTHLGGELHLLLDDVVDADGAVLEGAHGALRAGDEADARETSRAHARVRDRLTTDREGQEPLQQAVTHEPLLEVSSHISHRGEGHAREPRRAHASVRDRLTKHGRDKGRYNPVIVTGRCLSGPVWE